jgi:hypothetical protein
MKSIVALALLAFHILGHSAVITAASCSYADVNTAVNTTAADNDTVKVPSGTCTWATTLSITKGIRLLGAGIGNTVITKSANPIIRYQPSNTSTNAAVRIAGFTFHFNSQGGNGIEAVAGNTTNLQTKLRIDHNRFQNIALGSTQDHYIYFECMRGVIDNNQFGKAFYPFRAPTSCTPDGGAAIWNNQEGVVFGQVDNNLYFEDNIFEELTDSGGVIVMDCQEGGRYAFRYNNIAMTQNGQPLFDMHGNQGSSFYACMGGEIYGNSMTGAGVGGTFLDHRGGRAFVHHNQGAGFGIQVREEYADSISPVSYVGPNAPQYSQRVSGSYYWNNRTSATGSLWSVDINTTCSQCGENGLAAGVNFFTPSSSPAVSPRVRQDRATGLRTSPRRI